MGIINKIFKNEKVLINLFSVVLLSCGIIFGIIYYFYGSENLIDFCKYLFFYKDNEVTNNYNIYMTITGIYIFLSLFISTSFLGMFFNSFIIFTKGMQFTIATIFYFTLNDFSISMFFLGYIPQLFIELLLTYVISIISLRLSLNCFTITFITREVFNSRKIINYILDYVIVILIIVTLSMAFKVYAL
ncbi:hypothetical protein [Thomasclavelia saccharogumia]|uniref:hypothetical protein n=1 Tax=Thomasclavelia saccharogumia TaxID=341225 RepID=UPI00047A2259|nr:hypothetical protein [Thomasclavelia saccharogumia]